MTATDTAESVGGITRSFAGLAAGEAVARGIAFLGTLLIARRLGPSMYGIVGVASGILLYFNQVADAGIELSGVPAIARDREGTGALASATLTFRLLLALAVTLVVVGVSLALLPQPDGAVLAIYALSLASVAASTRWVLLGVQRASGVAVARASGEIVALAILIVGVRGAGDVAVVPFAFVAGAALTAMVMLISVRRLGLRLSWNPVWSLCRPLFARAPHLVGFTLLGLLLFNFDLIYLRFVRGSASAGFYAAAYTFVAFASNLCVAWSHSVMPALARLGHDTAQRNAVYDTALAMAFAVTLPVAVGGILVSEPLIEVVFGPRYGPAAEALRWLLPVVPLAAFRELAVAALIGSEGGERRLFRVNAVSVVLNVAIVVPVVPVFGLVGAAVATVATELVRLALTVRYARQAGFSAARYGRYTRPIVAAMLMATVLVVLAPASLLVLIGAGALVYAGTLAATGVLVTGGGRWPRLRV